MSFPLDIAAVALAFAAVAAGATVQATIGFGMAMTAAPFLLLIDTRLVPGPLLAAGLLLTTLMTRRDWHGIVPSTVGWAVLGGVPGTMLGALIISIIPVEVIGPVLGAIVLCGVAMSAVGHRIKPTRAVIVTAGAASGVMGTVASIGGPPLALLYQDEGGAALRGTMAGYFTISIVFALIALATVGRFGRTEWLLTVPLIPASLVGYVVGGWLAPRLNKDMTRIVLLWVCGAAGAVVIVRYLVW